MRGGFRIPYSLEGVAFRVSCMISAREEAKEARRATRPAPAPALLIRPVDRLANFGSNPLIRIQARQLAFPIQPLTEVERDPGEREQDGNFDERADRCG